MIKGSRIYFRHVEASDLNENYLAWMNDQDVTRYLEINPPYSIEDLKSYYQTHHHKPSEPWFAITTKDCMHIGNIKLGPINWIHRRADISIFIGYRALWGKGYGMEAISLMTDHAFKTLNLHKVMAGVYSQNIGSRKAFEKAGFRVEASLPRHVWTERGYDDLLLFSRFNETNNAPSYPNMEFSE